MPTLEQVTGRRDVTVLYLGDAISVTLEFYPDRISPSMMRQFSNLSHMDGATEEQVMAGIESIAGMLATLLAKWDLTESDAGPMVAISKERLTELGLPFLMQVFRRIWESIQLGETTGVPSKRHSNGSSHRKAR